MQEEKTAKKSLSDSVIEKLESIISEMKPGERLPPESVLAEEFSVGRSTIREGLKVLAYRKVVVRKPEGTFIAENTSEDCLRDPLNLILNMNVGSLSELIEVREQLEITAVKLAAQRASDDDVDKLERCNWLFKEPGIDAEEKRARDVAFHSQMAQCAHNTILAGLVNAVRQVIMENLEKQPVPHSIAEEGQHLHEELIHAIKEHDPDKAAAYMDEYLLLVDYNN